MTAETGKTTSVHRPDTGSETGRAPALRMHGQRIRTCMRATATFGDGMGQKSLRDEWNVVRGED
ncbi:hypothetical protein [Streptomyces sp. HD]|uniref:hypothetical protein n=1 Tax=Streptomyces sp. HD TaxID=3020892 RepID=UPI00232E249A|nr:hypothetical protein [Streptomyces sp. HD]MDC0765355.1 hypothetical protein [Streptomyces sp. HD]